MSYHQALNLILKLNEAVVGCTREILRQRDCLDCLYSKFLGVIPNFRYHERASGPLIMAGFFGISVRNLATTDWSMDIVAEFCSSSRWKELSKETSSKILPCGDGSCWKTFKPVASLITKGIEILTIDPRNAEVRGNEHYCFATTGRLPNCSLREAQSIPYSIVARFGVIFMGYG
ncbi:hypothetical protein Tco_0736549 [Tanacetum coccineum]